MNTIKIALVQHSSPVGSTKENLDTTVILAQQAHKAGVKLVCFPELNITGHAGHPDMVNDAEEVPGGASCERLIKLARELDMYICAGIAEKEKGIHYNTMFIAGPHGYVGKQRKVHLSRDEYFYFRAGTNMPLFDLSFSKVGIIICYDNEVPEVSRCLAVKGAEFVLCPHAARFGDWPDNLREREKAVEDQKSHWKLVHSCRAYDNGFFVALCNTAGRSAETIEGVESNHAGGCMVFDPDGSLIAESKNTDITDEMVTAELDIQKVAGRRKKPCFNLQTRKPEVFTVLTEPTG